MKRRWIFLLIATLLLVALAALMAAPGARQPPHPYFAHFPPRPLVIAHADDTGNGLWPGSTMPFLHGSAELGVDVLELDVHMTRDGHIVVMHDETVDRTTNGTGKISEMTLQEIKALEVAGDWSNDGGQTYPYRGAGLRVPTLAEVFFLFPDNYMNIEIKQVQPPMARELCQLIHNFGMEQKVLVPSFSDDALAEFRAVCPEVATAAGSNEVRNFVMLNFAYMAELLPVAYEAFQVPESSSGIPVVTPSFLEAAHGRNLWVDVWTINDTEQMQRFIDMGVDGIMTDRPDRLLQLLDTEEE